MDGFGVRPFDWSPLAKMGEAYANGLREYEARELSKKLGTALKGGDFDGAAGLAFGGGHADVGFQIMKLGEARRQTRLGEQASADFVNSLSGGAGGDAGAGAPSIGPRADRSIPSFTSNDGAIGSYLAGTRAKESGGNDLARNPNSSAFGRYQITDQTWAGLAKRNPDLGLTPDGRSDPAQQERAMARLTDENARSLSSAGITINPQSLYGAHFLGAPGFKRFYFGTNNNPDAPAVNYVSPGAASANRSVFYNQDGSPKRAAEVLDWMGRGYGGGRVAAAPASRPAAPDFAANEAETQRLEAKLAMLPADALAYDPRADLPAEGAMPTIAQAPSGFGVPPLQAGFQRSLPSSDPNARNVPPSAVQPGGLTGAPTSVSARDMPPTVNSDSWQDGAAPPGRMSPPAPVPTLGGGIPDRVMQLPPEAGGPPVQVAQAGGVPDLSSPAGRQAEAATRQLQGIGASGLGSQQRIQAISRAIANPYLPDGPRELAKTMLQEELQRTRLPENVKTFLYYRGAGLTQAQTPAEFEREMKGPQTAPPGSAVLKPDGSGVAFVVPDRDKLTGDIDAREAAAGRMGLRPGTPEFQSYVLTGKMPKEDQQAPSATDRKAIMAAEDRLPELNSTIDRLARAKDLNDETFTGYWSSLRGDIGSTLPDGLVPDWFADRQGAMATREFAQNMSMEAISAMSQTLKGATTDREMDRFMKILGDPTTPPEIRKTTIDRLMTLAQREKRIATDRLNQLRSGTYYQQGGGASRDSEQQLVAPPPAAAVDHLRANPALRNAFDQKYGPGSAASVLGR